MTVSDLPQDFILIMNDSEVETILEDFGVLPEGYHWVLVDPAEVEKGELAHIWCGYNIPHQKARVYPHKAPWL